jgi:hypothetical protein
MKRIKYILITVLLISAVACENVDFRDINDNVNGLTAPATSGLLSSSIMTFATQTNRTGITIPTLMVQYQAQVTYTDEMLYAQTPYSWAAYYSGVIHPLNLVISTVSDPAKVTPEVLLQGSAENQGGVARIFKAYAMKRVTDTWGDVPNDEAGLGLNDVSPAYDTQESIYQDIVTWLREGRDMIDPSTKAPTGDILYKGNLTNWQKFANSLLMQVGLQLSEVNPTLGSEIFNEALIHEAGFIDEVSEEAWFSYTDLTGFRNPWNANRTADYFLTQEFTDALKGNVAEGSLNPTSNHTYDSRYKVYVRATAANPTPNGVPYGYRDGSGAGKAQMNRNYYWNAVSPLPVMTASYTFLNRAEALQLGWTTANETMTVDELLTEGIVKSFETLESHSKTSITKPAGETIAADAAAYAAARLVDAQTVGYLQVIGEEKWKSLYGQAFDAWAEFRRTGFPVLTPATDFYNNGEIPTRYMYPNEEATLNGTNYDAAVSRIGEDLNTTRVWWDVD